MGLTALVACLSYTHWLMQRQTDRIAGSVLDLPERTTVIVPGALVEPDGTPSDALKDRLACALDVYQSGKAKRILVSGDHGSDTYDEPNAMRRWLIERGVPAFDVFTDHAGFRTLDTMQRASHVFGIRDAVVCTQAFHLPRSLYLAQQAGIDASGLASDRRLYAHAQRDALRERIAALGAVLDTLLSRAPRHLGPPIPIEGSAHASLDARGRALR